MRNFQTFVESIKTHVYPENRAVYEIMWKNIYSRTGHRWQYGACTLHAGYQRLQTHTQNM